MVTRPERSPVTPPLDTPFPPLPPSSVPKSPPSELPPLTLPGAHVHHGRAMPSAGRGGGGGGKAPPPAHPCLPEPAEASSEEKSRFGPSPGHWVCIIGARLLEGGSPVHHAHRRGRLGPRLRNRFAAPPVRVAPPLDQRPAPLT